MMESSRMARSSSMDQESRSPSVTGTKAFMAHKDLGNGQLDQVSPSELFRIFVSHLKPFGLGHVAIGPAGVIVEFRVGRIEGNIAGIFSVTQSYLGDVNGDRRCSRSQIDTVFRSRIAPQLTHGWNK